MLENLGRENDVEIRENRRFGIKFFLIPTLIAVCAFYVDPSWAYIPAMLAATFLVTALISPEILSWPIRRLRRLGMSLQILISPVILGLIFFLVVLPTGLITKLCRKDILRLQRDADASSYWIVRNPPGPAPQTMSRQF